MRLDSCRASLVNFRIPQVIPSHRLARHARALHQSQLHPQSQPLFSSSTSSSLQDEQRSIEESIMTHRRAAIGDLNTGTPTPTPTPSLAPALPHPSSNVRSLTVTIPAVEPMVDESEVDSSLPPSSSAVSGPSFSRSSSPASVFSPTGDEVPISSDHRITDRSPSPVSFYMSPSLPTRTLNLPFLPLSSSSDPSSSSSSPVVSSSSLSRPSARLQRVYRRMTIYTEEEEEPYISSHADPTPSKSASQHHQTSVLPPTSSSPSFSVYPVAVDSSFVKSYPPVVPLTAHSALQQPLTFPRPPTPTLYRPQPLHPHYSHPFPHSSLPYPQPTLLPPPAPLFYSHWLCHYQLMAALQQHTVVPLTVGPSTVPSYVVPAHLISTVPSSVMGVRVVPMSV